MARRVKLHLREGVALVTLAALEGGPSKAGVFDLAAGFDAATRVALAGALDVALTDSSVAAIVLRSGPEGWPYAPRDPVADYRPVAGVPDLGALAARIAASEKPVIAALSGRISGGALAISQAAGWRFAERTCVFAALEPALGYLPGGGGLVEIARRLGAEAALGYVLSGRDWTAREVAQIGLIDGVGEAGSADSAALALAQMLVAGQTPPQRRAPDAGLADPAGYLAAVSATRKMAFGGAIPARVAHRIVDVVEAGLLLPEAELIDFEAVALSDLLDAPVAKALRYQALSMERADRLAGFAAPEAAPETPPATVGGGGRVALWHCGGESPDDTRTGGAWSNDVGAGGAAIRALGRLAGRLADHGPVQLGAASETDLEELFAVVARGHAVAVEAGRMTAEQAEAAWAQLDPCVDEADLAGADWAVVSPPSGGAAGMMQLARVAQGIGNTPKLLLDLGAGAAFSVAQAEDRVGGTGDAWGVMRLGPQVAELVLNDDAEDAPLIAQGLRRAGFVAVRGGAAQAGGGIAVRMQAALLLAAERTAIAGADPMQIDRVLSGAGFGEGPFRRLDRAGRTASLRLLARAGRGPGLLISQWTGGFYGAGGTAAEGLGDALGLLREGRAARRLSDGQVVARIVAELAGEGAALLLDGGAHRPSDIDLVMVCDCGMRADIGGPMHMADGIGLLTIRNQLRMLAAEGARAPVALWDALIKNGRKFADLDGR